MELKDFAKIKEKEVKLEGCKFGEHFWSAWFSCPQGLGRECKKCGKIESGKFINGEFILNPILDEHGFALKENGSGQS